MPGKSVLGVEEIGKTGGVCFGDLSSANKHEPLDASHGAEIMTREVGVVLFIFLSTMNLAPHYKAKQLLVTMIAKIWNEMFQ